MSLQVQKMLSILWRIAARCGPLPGSSLRRGRMIDRGMDPHDLRVRALGSKQEVALPQLTPGQRWDGVVSLRPGVYSLWCSLPEHAKLGMRATLTVVR